MKAIDVILKYGWENDECDEAIKEIKELQDKLTKAQSYIVELESKLRGHIKENGWMNK